MVLRRLTARARPVAAALLLLLGIGTCSDPIASQIESGTNVLTGRVLGGFGRGVPGAHVELEGRFGRVEAYSGELLGEFRFGRLPDGIATLTASRGADTVRTVVDLARVPPMGVHLRLPGWSLAWHDEFDGEALDTTKWFAWRDPAMQAAERTDYRPEQLSVEKGILRMRTDDLRPGEIWHRTGGMHGRHFQRYGRFEIRARLPRGQGMWPAHWLTNSDSAEPYFEFDIVEMLGRDPRRLYFHHHYKTSIARTGSHGTSFRGPFDYSAGFHTYRIDWYAGNAIWYVDGVERFRATGSIGDRPVMLRINTAVGGSWSGLPDETTSFPQYHDIDWVRIYRLER